MAGRDLDADFLIGASNKARIGSGFTQHWKYPQTVGNSVEGGRDSSGFNFNSHEASEFAIKRMDNISQMTNEPFMMFEFMSIDEDKAQAKIKAGSQQIKNTASAVKNLTSRTISDPENVIQEGYEAAALGMANRGISKEELAGGWKAVKNKISGFITDASTPAERNYTGSIALYMPTDIQINDSMVYNEDTRKLGANLEGILDADVDLMNLTTLTDPAVLAAIGAGVGALPFVPGGAAIGAVLAGSLGQIAQTEVQRHLGQVMNPNELARYSQTALRTFTFNWIILPDNEYESDQAAGLIKFFRKSAHAKRTNATVVTVPDHVITSFHGAKDMIQLPPCFIESVNVTYNPNNSSFFKRNNAPVEIGLGITMKEIVPIYSQDVERGF